MPKQSLNFLNKYKTLGLLNQELIKTIFFMYKRIYLKD